MVNFMVALQSQNPGGLFAAAKQNPKNHVRLSAQQVAAAYGATPQSIMAVTQFMQDQGFVFLGEEPNGLALQFQGLAGQINSAFQTSLERYRFQGHTGYAPATGIAIPSPLTGMVSGVLGLDTLIRPVSNLQIANSKIRKSQAGVVFD
ncbi:serine protease, subtilase family protein, partial [mine drainage metagenome]